MSELLTAAASALAVPESLVARSAAARAQADGTGVDDVLAAWSGGEPPTAPTAESETTAPPAAAPAPAVAKSPPAQTAPAAIPIPAMPQPTPAPTHTAVVEIEEFDPIPLSQRIRTATRVGGWTGAVLGLLGFLVASTWWSKTASITGQDPFTPVIQVDRTSLVQTMALISIVFGVAVAGLSRAAAGWANRGMQLTNSPRSTAILGGAVGLVLGVVGGAVLAGGIGTELDGSDGVVQLPVFGTLAVMIIGGAVLGLLTALVTQMVAVPRGSAEDPAAVDEMKGRLQGAVGIPTAGLLLLLLLVLPFAWALIRSNELAPGGGALVAVLAASGVLAFATLAGSRPNMKIGVGELLVAIVGIGTVLAVILAVLNARGPAETHAEGPGGSVAIEALSSIAFDSNAWTAAEGPVSFIYTDQGENRHTLTIAGLEEDLHLLVEGVGDTDSATIDLSPGSYVVYCDIKGHREAGMEGTLTVTPATN